MWTPDVYLVVDCFHLAPLVNHPYFPYLWHYIQCQRVKIVVTRTTVNPVAFESDNQMVVQLNAMYPGLIHKYYYSELDAISLEDMILDMNSTGHKMRMHKVIVLQSWKCLTSDGEDFVRDGWTFYSTVATVEAFGSIITSTVQMISPRGEIYKMSEGERLIEIMQWNCLTNFALGL